MPLTSTQLSVLADQRYVFALWQLTALGIPSAWVRRRVAARMWQRVGQRCVIASPAPPTTAQLRFASCLELGPSAVLAGQAALVEAGWSGEDPGRYDVLVPPDRKLARGRTVPVYIRVRYGLPYGEVIEGVPRTTNPRAIVDAVSWARTDREADFIVVSAVKQSLASTRSIRAEAARRRFRRSGLLATALREIDRGVESMPELLFLRLCRARGFPEPTLQRRVRDANGRLRRVDFSFTLPDGSMLMVEIDGAGHLDAEQAERDALRGSSLARATGAHAFRVPHTLLKHDPDAVFAELAQWLAS